VPVQGCTLPLQQVVPKGVLLAAVGSVGMQEFLVSALYVYMK
jgi:hypothetical protein